MISCIIFREILNNKVLCSRLDCLLGWLSFSGDDPKFIVPAISCLVLLAFMPYFLAFSRPRNGDHIDTRAALQVLHTVVVPRCSLWPSCYIKFASTHRSRVDIPLEVIIEDTINGVIEFRNPVDDLAILMDSGVTVNGYIIRIKIGWRWWANWFEWMLAKSKPDCLPLRSPGYMLDPSDWLCTNMPAANSRLPGLSLSPFAPTSSSCAVFCLDHLPRGIIPSLNAGCKTTLEFTALSPSLRALSAAQIISAIPFIISEHPHRWPRPVVSVLKQLSVSYGTNIVIDSLSNVSVDYEHALRRMHKSFSGKQKNREMSVKILGIKAWRRSMFLVALEAALVSRGWIERWAIQVTVK